MFPVSSPDDLTDHPSSRTAIGAPDPTDPKDTDVVLASLLPVDTVCRLRHLARAHNRWNPHDVLTLQTCICRIAEILYEQFHTEAWTGGRGDWSGDWDDYQNAPPAQRCAPIPRESDPLEGGEAA